MEKGGRPMENENTWFVPDENTWINSKWLEDLAEKMDSKGREERQREEAKKAAEAFKMYFDAFVSVGFNEDQAMDLLIGLVGMVSGR